MNHILLIITVVAFMAILIDFVIYLLPTNRRFLIMNNRTRVYIIILMVFIAFAISYFPRHMFSIDHDEVAYIQVKNGSTGETYRIEDELVVSQILNDINSIKYKKEKSSLFYMGYGYRLLFYSDNEKIINRITVNSCDKVRYRGFFYNVVEGKINLENLEKNLVY